MADPVICETHPRRPPRSQIWKMPIFGWRSARARIGGPAPDRRKSKMDGVMQSWRATSDWSSDRSPEVALAPGRQRKAITEVTAIDPNQTFMSK